MKNFPWLKIISCIILVAIGIFLVILGVKNLKSPTETYVEHKAVVSLVLINTVKDNNGLSTEKRTVYVDYEVDGKAYTHIEYNDEGNHKEGDEVTILYNPENPSQIATGNERPFGVYIIVFGALFFVGAAFILFNNTQYKRTNKGKGKKKR